VNDLTTELVKKGDVLFIPGATMDATALSEALGELFKDPLGVSWRLSSPYGYRPDPFTGVRSFHTGIDMVAPLGTSIKASMAGKVAAAGYNQVYGNYVIVSHSGGYQTLYAHMTTILVKLGQNVNQGSVLGKLGSTGYSTGPHLHFSVYKNGQLINPLSVLK
jgi:murein DD-endopeptidase MepM/ murein hydrolase activator NlpD